MSEKAPVLARILAGWKEPEKRVKWIVGLGIAGILLIFLSQFAWSGDAQEQTLPEESITSTAYTRDLQAELTGLISKISGAGKTEVMVTIQNDGETLYVREQKSEQDTTRTDGGTVNERESLDESYVLVDGREGRSALVRTHMEPVIKGVVVVCEGGDDPVTAGRIMEAVTTALSVSSAKVCITKLA